MKVTSKKIIRMIMDIGVLFFLFLPSHDTLLGNPGKYMSTAVQIIALIFCLFFSVKKLRKRDFFIISIMLFEFEIITACFVNNTSIVSFSNIALKIISVVLFMSIELEYDSKSLLQSLIVVLSFFALMNLYYRISDNPITYVIKTGPVYYLGSDNEASSILLLLFTVGVYYCALIRINILSIVAMALPLFTAFYTKSGTAIVVYLIFGIFCVLYFIPGGRRIIEKVITAYGMMMLFIGYYIILWGLTLAKFGFLGDVIANLTGKNAVTFTGRDEIWIEAIRIIREHPIIGLGFGEGGSLGNGVFVRGFNYGAHNLILQWGVNGGIIAVIIILVMILFVFKKIAKMEFPYCFIFFLPVYMYLIASSMENYGNGIHFFPILVLAYYLSGEQVHGKKKIKIRHLIACKKV